MKIVLGSNFLLQNSHIYLYKNNLASFLEMLLGAASNKLWQRNAISCYFDICDVGPGILAMSHVSSPIITKSSGESVLIMQTRSS
jgi:hypothetical protein